MNNYLFAENVFKKSDSNTMYFPANTFLHDTANQIDNNRNIWYSKMLYALHEPILYTNQNDSLDIYRFTWLRTFHNPISIRVRKVRNQFILTLKKTEGSGGYEAGDVIKDTSFFISRDEWDVVINKVSKINFWELKSLLDDGGKDGSEWILEGRRNNQYHFVSRWSPSTTRYFDFKDCCDYLLHLSNVKLTNKEMY